MQKRSELEGGLDKSTKVAESGATVEFRVAIVAHNFVGESTQGAAQLEHSRSDADVVGDLELIPPFTSVVAVVGEGGVGGLSGGINAVGPQVQAGGKGGLAEGHPKGIAPQEDISPLQADEPALGLTYIGSPIFIAGTPTTRCDSAIAIVAETGNPPAGTE